MKLFLKISVLLAAVVGFATSCDQVTDIMKKPSLTPTELVIPAEGGSVLLTVNSPVAWSLVPNSDWIKVSPRTGVQGNTQVEVSADANESDSPRTSRISLSVEGYATLSASVSQEPVDKTNPGTDKVTDIILNRNSLELEVGQTYTLSATPVPATSKEKIKWMSVSSSVSVDDNGTVTALSAGTGSVVAYVGTVESIADLINVVFSECVVTVTEPGQTSSDGSTLEDPEDGGKWTW